jgi:hypothetical protein
MDSQWCLSELPHPSQPLPPNLLFKFGDRFYCLVHWSLTLLNSLVVGPLQVNMTAVHNGMPIRRLGTIVRRDAQLQTLFATCDGKWVQGHAVLPDSNLSFFDAPPPLPPRLMTRHVLVDTAGLQTMLNSMHQAEKKTIFDPLPHITRDRDFVAACAARQPIVFAQRELGQQLVAVAAVMMKSIPLDIKVALGLANADLPEQQVRDAIVGADALADLPILCMPPIEWDATNQCLRGSFSWACERVDNCWVSIELFTQVAERIGATVDNCGTLGYMLDATPDQGIERLKQDLVKAEVQCLMRRTTKSNLFNADMTRRRVVKHSRKGEPLGHQSETADHSHKCDQSDEEDRKLVSTCEDE